MYTLLISLCSWCQRETDLYGAAVGVPVTPAMIEQYHRRGYSVTHGCCKACAEKVKAEIAAFKLGQNAK